MGFTITKEERELLEAIAEGVVESKEIRDQITFMCKFIGAWQMLTLKWDTEKNQKDEV